MLSLSRTDLNSTYVFAFCFVGITFQIALLRLKSISRIHLSFIRPLEKIPKIELAIKVIRLKGNLTVQETGKGFGGVAHI